MLCDTIQVIYDYKMINFSVMMKYQSFLCFCVITLLFIETVFNYPVYKSYSEGKPIRDEKRYPNGTVVGKYSYTDNEGNPIQVKYYADNESYGVELKSIKVMDTNDNLDPQAHKHESMVKATETPRIISEFMTTKHRHYGDKNTNDDPYEYLNKEVAGISHPKAHKTNPEFDIYFQNEMQSPKKINKDKVRIYLDKEKRKIRNTHGLTSNKISKYCDRF